MANVKFKQGLASSYSGIASVEQDTFYVTTDDQEMYLGDKKLTSKKEIDEINEMLEWEEL